MLAQSTTPFKDILAWIPYGVLHYVLPIVTAILIVCFGPPGTLPVYARTFGYMNVAGVLTQIFFPCAPPCKYLSFILCTTAAPFLLELRKKGTTKMRNKDGKKEENKRKKRTKERREQKKENKRRERQATAAAMEIDFCMHSRLGHGQVCSLEVFPSEHLPVVCFCCMWLLSFFFSFSFMIARCTIVVAFVGFGLGIGLGIGSGSDGDSCKPVVSLKVIAQLFPLSLFPLTPTYSRQCLN
jgi:hypothetical protein